jgi:peptidyl-prolyl cis-trans isomerase SurA
MKTKQIKQFFKISALAIALSSSFVSLSHANTKDEIVAVVDNSAILRSDLDQGVAEIGHRLQAQNKEIPPVEYLERQALDDLITRQAQLEQVKRYNIKPDEQSLNAAVLKVARDSGADSLEAFQKKLDAIAPNTYASFRARVAEDIALQRLRQQIVMSRIQVTDQDVQNFLNTPQGQTLLGNQVHVLHLRVAGTEQVEAVAQNVKTALTNSNDIQSIAKQFSNDKVNVAGQDMGLRSMSEIPSELAARVSTLDLGQTTELIQAADGIHILKLLERKSSEKKAVVPQYLTRHILIQTSEVVSDDAAKQMIQSLYNRVQKGEDFAVLAGTFSNDPGSARDGGSLGWVSPGVMVPEFEQRMKDTPVGQVTAPFQSQFGWHILQVTDTRQQDMTREYQERMARQLLGERQFDTELDSWLREIRNNAFVDIKDKRLDPKQSS